MSEGRHTHAGDISDIKARKAMEKTKKMAKQSGESTSNTANRTLENVAPATATLFLPIAHIIRTV